MYATTTYKTCFLVVLKTVCTIIYLTFHSFNGKKIILVIKERYIETFLLNNEIQYCF